MPAPSSLLLLAAAFAIPAVAEVNQQAANPVRKVVTLLQKMQQQVAAEGEKEEELFKKFSCYCKTGTSELQASISAANVKGPSLAADIKAAEEQLAQTKQELKDAQKERAEAKAAIASATGIREKEAAAFAKEKAELDEYIDTISTAVSALTKGMAGSFLQTTTAQLLKKIVLSSRADGMTDDEKEGILAFLSGKQDASYAPQSGEITGILKSMGDSMAKNLAEATEAESAAVKEFDALVAAKKKEIDALTASVESKTTKVGELGVSIVTMQGDQSDTERALEEDKKMLAELEKGCATKDKEYEERVKTRTEELAAIAETIKILNDDDALELFKKTLPAPSASLVQMHERLSQVRDRAISALEQVAPRDRARLDFILLALRGKKPGFEKVIKLIDDMVASLKKEQTSDDDKKEYCQAQLDSTEDKQKALARSVSDTETAIVSAEEGISKMAEEIAALEAGIKALDKQVAEATEQRKEENEEYKGVMQSNSAAKELLLFAKNRLNKFYNPKLYNPPAKKELSEAGAIERDMAFVQISEHRQRAARVEPPPETWDAYAKKSEETTGVIEMIDLLVKDLEKDMTEAEVEEKNSQSAYDEMIADAKEKRTVDSKSLTEKGAAKADLTADLQTAKDTLKSTKVEAMAVAKFAGNLHAECDWLLQYFDVRKEARAGEIDALLKAKAVLSGADYSMLQTRAAGLRGRAL